MTLIKRQNWPPLLPNLLAIIVAQKNTKGLLLKS
jgi:hypothetical protein